MNATGSTTHPLARCLVRFRDPRGTICGAGFLATTDLVCTCAHVVATALGADGESRPPPDTVIALDLPFLGAAAEATVLEWVSEPTGDIAVLRLTDPLPPGAVPVPPVPGGPVTGRTFDVVGFPAGNDEGAWAEGAIGRARADATVQLEGVRVTGYAVQPGFSGAPVWDRTGLGVVGMVLAAERDTRTKVGVMVPVDAIGAVCPSLAAAVARPVRSLGAGLAGLPGSPLDGFEHFLREYLGTAEAPAPFGGRDAALADLSAWLVDPSRPFALLVAEAGRGKSALLVRWVAALAARGGVDVAFLPVSIRFGTADHTAAMGVLGARLRHLHGEGGELPSDPHAWIREISIRLRQDRDGARPLLVVLDGADEATDWDVGRDLRFPSEVGRGVKILVSARAVAGRDTAAWGRILGWSDAHPVALPLLDSAQIREALRSLGGELRTLAERDDTAAEIARLSGGDPLLVRLWAETLRDDPVSGPRAVADLADRSPGLHAFFDQWWADQKEYARRRRPDLEGHQERLQQFFYLCATALGPVSREEAARLGAGLWTSSQLQDLTADARRFVTGDGSRQGWVFSHPMLAQYFAEEQMVEADRAEWEHRFLALGDAALADLRAGHPLPRGRRYPLAHQGAHVVRDHAARCAAGAGCGCADRLDALVDAGWHAARESAEGTPDGFLADVGRAWGHQENSPGAGDSVARWVRYALVRSSVRSRTAALPMEMVAALVRRRIWTQAQALSHARGLPDDERAATLVALVPEVTDLREEVRAMARALPEAADALRVLLHEAVAAPEAERAGLLAVALADLDDAVAASGPRILHAVARSVPETVLDSLLERVRRLPPQARVVVLSAYATAVPARPQLWTEAAADIDAWPEDALDQVPVKVIRAVPADRAGLLVRRVVEAAIACRGESQVHYPLARLLNLPDELRAPVVAGLVAQIDHAPVAQRAEAAAATADTLAWAPGVPSPALVRVVTDAVQVALATSDARKGDDIRARAVNALAELSERLPAPERRTLATEAVAAATMITTEYVRARALVGLAGMVPDELEEAVVTAAATLPLSDRLRVQASLPAYRSRIGAQALADQALAHLEEWEAAKVLETLMPHLPPRTVLKVLRMDAAREAKGYVSTLVLGEGPAAIDRLADEAARLPDDARATLLTGVADIAELLRRPMRDRFLSRLAPVVPDDALRDLAAVMGRIGDDLARATAVAALLPAMPPAARAGAADDALNLVGPALGRYAADTVRDAVLPFASPAAVERIARAVARSGAIGVEPVFQRLAELDVERALAVARSVEFVGLRDRALAATAAASPAVAAAVWRELEADRADDLPPVRRALRLLHLGLPAPDELVAAALAAAGDLPDAQERAETLEELVPYADLEQFPGVLDRVVAAVEDLEENARRRVLTRIALRLPGPVHGRLLAEVLRHQRDVPGPTVYWELRNLAPVLPEYLLTTALDVALGLDDEQDLATALVALAPRLPAPLLSRALPRLATVASSYRRADIAAALLARLAELGEVREAVDRAFGLGNDTETVQAVIAIAPHLPGPLLVEVSSRLGPAQWRRDPTLVAAVLVRAGEVGNPVVALQEAATIEDSRARGEALARLAALVVDREMASQVAWSPMLWALAARPREELVADLAALAPLLGHAGGAEAIARAVIEVGTWLP